MIAHVGPVSLRILPIALLLLATPALAQQRGSTEWPDARGDEGARRYSPLTQINRENVGDLQVGWVYHTGDAGEGNDTQIENTPLVVDDVVYLTTANRKLVALDATTGRELWKHDFLPQGRYGSYPLYHGDRGLNRGVAYWSDAEGREQRILLGTTDGRLLSIDAWSGKADTAFGKGGAVDLRENLDRNLVDDFYGLTSPPAVYRDLVILGVSAAEGTPTRAPGDIRAFDVRNGEDRGGVNPWSGLTIDAERGMVFAATGAPGYDYYGGDRRGRICSPIPSSRWTRIPGSGSGTTRSSTTTSGITICRTRLSW